MATITDKNPMRGEPACFVAGRQRRLCSALWIAISLLATSSTSAEQPDAAGLEFFENRIRPVLVKHCYRCHSSEAKSAKGGLLLDTRAGTLQGGETGPAVVKNEVDESLLIDAIRYESFEMPPNERLSENVIADFVTWVELGATDPRDGSSASEPNAIAEDFWAFQQPRRTKIGESIDSLVEARRTAAGLQAVKSVDRRSLLRRVYFDLIGLPPTTEQLESFLNDTADTQRALERVVDQLLGSPHFGERWGRHWLDVARYAESTGKEWNWAHPEAWRYRDYVIKSFNDDKGYDQFLREQIAGDLLPAADRAQRDEQLIATGFLAIGPKAVSINDDEIFALELADEQINTVSRAILGLTVGCARCHDHKFDPISAKDYYALSGIFQSTQTLFGTSASGYKGRNNKQGTPLIPIGKNAERLHQATIAYNERVKKLTTELTEKRDALKELCEEQSETNDERAELADESNDEQKHQDLIAQHHQSIETLEQEIEALTISPPAKPDYAMGTRDRDDPRDCELRIGGEIDQKGDAAPRGFLTSLRVADDLDVNPKQSGRKELAEWLSHRDNPLTARVMVNRIWLHLFGRGLVPTVDNFGWLGKRPSHPHLLDHLAVTFVEDDWSVKRLIRRIVLSHTYRLSTSYDAVAAGADPNNQWLWRMRPRRLEAEEIRDAILAISGNLNREPLVGSPVVGRLDEGWIGNEVKEPAFKEYAHKHRSVYLPIVRDSVPEMLQTFDFPDPAEVTGQRQVSVVPAQALFLLNSEFVVAEAREVAEQLIHASGEGSDAELLVHAYQRLLGRSPSKGEQQRGLKMILEVDRVLQKQGHDSLAARRDAWTALVQSLFCSGEFLHLF